MVEVEVKSISEGPGGTKTEGLAGFEPRSPDIDRDDELATEGSNPSGITEKSGSY